MYLETIYPLTFIESLVVALSYFTIISFLTLIFLLGLWLLRKF